MRKSDCIEEYVAFPSQDVVLEGILSYPAKEEPDIALLLLTPHPHMGGRMDNNVIEHIARHAAEDGALTLRFNYHGVGKSACQLPEGESLYDHWADMETNRRYEELLPDANAALDYLKQSAGDEFPVVFLGYSLGAILAGLLSRDEKCERVIAIAPPNAQRELSGFECSTCAKLFVAGDKDFAFDRETFLNAFEKYPNPKAFTELRGSDHFFRKEEEHLYQTIKPFIFVAQRDRNAC